jgi:3'-5' exonuclease
LVREALGEKFPKHLFHSIVCIGALIARPITIPGPWEVVALGAPHIGGERTEAELITAFVARIAELEPRLSRSMGLDLTCRCYVTGQCFIE